MKGRPTTRTHQSVTIPGLGHTTIGAVVDVRSQFVAFASSSIERSAAKLVSHNRALCESFGRDWVVGCCKQIGTTVAFPALWAVDSDEMEPEWCREHVNVFIGVSATLGVVWCTCLDYRASGCITVTVGDDRFMCDERKPSCVVDSRGNVVATLNGQVDQFAIWRTNRKWLVKVDAARNLVVYRMNNGVPVCPSHATVLKCTLPLKGDGARFSPFDPCGDEIVLVGDRGGEGGFISFVDLEKSCGAGVTMEARESHALPHSNPFDLVWSSPDTILTLHRNSSHDCYRVYNTVTGELHTFPDYHLQSVSALHMVWVNNKSSMYEVYSASDMSTPLCQHEKSPMTLDYCCSSDEVYVVRRDDSTQDVVDMCIHDAKTATPLAFLTVEIDGKNGEPVETTLWSLPDLTASFDVDSHSKEVISFHVTPKCSSTRSHIKSKIILLVSTIPGVEPFASNSISLCSRDRSRCRRLREKTLLGSPEGIIRPPAVMIGPQPREKNHVHVPPTSAKDLVSYPASRAKRSTEVSAPPQQCVEDEPRSIVLHTKSTMEFISFQTTSNRQYIVDSRSAPVKLPESMIAGIPERIFRRPVIFMFIIAIKEEHFIALINSLIALQPTYEFTLEYGKISDDLYVIGGGHKNVESFCYATEMRHKFLTGNNPFHMDITQPNPIIKFLGHALCIPILARESWEASSPGKRSTKRGHALFKSKATMDETLI
ncbi:hypothetical protein Pelo_810 [Pelomyxa schiedti]|nr:hypothetical protein Pelo_810 [Pelomyxa schiedti]